MAGNPASEAQRQLMIAESLLCLSILIIDAGDEIHGGLTPNHFVCKEIS
jgi:hypothetical protein